MSPAENSSSQPIELIVTAIRVQAARCLLLKDGQEVTLRASGFRSLVPGEITSVRSKRSWKPGRTNLSADILESRLDVAALGLTPLALSDVGAWDPNQGAWRQDSEDEPAWQSRVLALGPRSQFEMEKIVPEVGGIQVEGDPIDEAVRLWEGGDHPAATNLLMDLLAADLRCLDAHAQLGAFHAGTFPREAIRHFEVGLRIGEQTLGDDFAGLLPWRLVGNRPFLRCLHGFGLCLSRLNRRQEALSALEQLLLLSPEDELEVAAQWAELSTATD